MEDRLRLLARWQARRREVDELLEPLLAHGPAAVERVTAKLGEVGAALRAEQLAYAAFEAAAAQAREQHPVAPPDISLDPMPVDEVRDEVAAARRRALRSRYAELTDTSLDLELLTRLNSGPMLELVETTPAPRPSPDRD